jgi:ATP-dependent exoDNAse (exonuclease V) alpha subunit
MPSLLSGQIESITFTNAETGFTIARVRVEGRRDPMTVVGGLLAPVPGELLEMEGDWAFHPRFGEQFKVERFSAKVPATVEGIRRYLGSGLIKGLGPVMAGRIVDHFGVETLEVIEHDVGRLAEVAGIGRRRIAMVAEAWRTQREIRDLMLFLQSHGVGAGYAVRIFKRYGNRAAVLVRENPYRLATDIEGIGFLTADRIAEKFGFPRDAPMRLAAGALYTLQQLSDDGLFTWTRVVSGFSSRVPFGQNTAAPYANIMVAVFQTQPVALAAVGLAPCSQSSLPEFPWWGETRALSPSMFEQIRPYVEKLGAEAVQVGLRNAGLLP